MCDGLCGWWQRLHGASGALRVGARGEGVAARGGDDARVRGSGVWRDGEADGEERCVQLRHAAAGAGKRAAHAGVAAFGQAAAAHVDAAAGEGRAGGAGGSAPGGQLRQARGEPVRADRVAVHSHPAGAAAVHVGGAAHPGRHHAGPHFRLLGHSRLLLAHQLCVHEPLLRQLLRHQWQPLSFLRPFFLRFHGCTTFLSKVIGHRRQSQA